MKTKFIFKSLYFFSFLILFLGSCSKSLDFSEPSKDQLDARASMLKIVGSKGQIVSFPSSIDDNVSILSSTEFQQVVKELINPKTYESKRAELIKEKNISKEYLLQTNSIKSFSYLDDEGPRRAGYYHVQFSANSNINDGLGGSYTLHLYFNTDSYGKVIGSPSLSYTGIGISSWQQVNMSSVSFNASNYTSSFTISGINTYGIQFGSFTLGWSSVSNFLIRVNMEESASKQVILIEQR